MFSIALGNRCSSMWSQCLWLCLMLALCTCAACSDICVEFREGNVNITGAAITTKHIYFVIETTLYRFPISSFNETSLSLSLKAQAPKKFNLKEIFPGKFDRAKITTMFVWYDKNEELLCFQDSSRPIRIDCFNEEKEIERKRLNPFLRDQQWIVMNATGYGHLITMDNETFLQRGYRRINKNGPARFVPQGPIYRVRRIAANLNYIILMNVNRKHFSDEEYRKARPNGTSKQMAKMDKLAFNVTVPQETGSRVRFNSEKMAVTIGFGFAAIRPLESLERAGDLIILKKKRKSLHKFFVCSDVFHKPETTVSKYIFITVLTVLMMLIVTGSLLLDCLTKVLLANKRAPSVVSLGGPTSTATFQKT